METTIFYDFGLMEKLFFFFLFSFLVNCLFSSLYSNGLASTSNSWVKTLNKTDTNQADQSQNTKQQLQAQIRKEQQTEWYKAESSRSRRFPCTDKFSNKIESLL